MNKRTDLIALAGVTLIAVGSLITIYQDRQEISALKSARGPVKARYIHGQGGYALRSKALASGDSVWMPAVILMPVDSIQTILSAKTTPWFDSMLAYQDFPLH